MSPVFSRHSSFKGTSIRLALLPILCVFLGASLARAQKAVEIQIRRGLPHFFARVGQSTGIRVAYLGGSITAAAGWRSQTLAWLSSTYPASHFSEINAAVSGTGSELGVFRLQKDALQFKPDLLFVEFAVNDEAEDPARIARAMEGIVRQTWTLLPDTDICFIYTVNKLSLATMEADEEPPSVVAMEHVADAYGIPSVNVGYAAARVMRTGAMTITGPPPSASAPQGSPVAFSDDGTHPYPTTGHRIYAQTIEHAFDLMKSQPADSAPHKLTAPLDPLNLFAAQETPFSQVQHAGSWAPATLEDPTGQVSRSLPQVWAGRKTGDAIDFQFNGTVFGLYGVKGPDAAEFLVQIDDNPAIKQTFFDAYSTAGRYRCRSWISQDLPKGPHRAHIVVLGPTLNKKEILHKQAASEAALPDTAGFALYLGAILTDGPILSLAQPHPSTR